MKKIKVGNNKKRAKVYENNVQNISSRQKIKTAERKSIILHKLKENFLKITAFCIVLFFILIYIVSNKRVVVEESSNISKLNANKYITEITNLYNRDGELVSFLAEMNKLQALIGMYAITNSTLKENSFSNIIKDLNKEINKDESVKLGYEKSKYYNGKYSIDDIGNLKFKFGSKEIEPTWINDSSISRYIILN